MKRLTKDHFSFKCPMSWDQLDPISADKRFCQQCQKNVYDLSNCSLEEIQELQSKKGSICGMTRIMSATTIAASLSMAACTNDKPQILGGIAPIPQQNHVSEKCDKPADTAQTVSDPDLEIIVKPAEEDPFIENNPPMILGKIVPMERPIIDPESAS